MMSLTLLSARSIPTIRILAPPAKKVMKIVPATTPSSRPREPSRTTPAESIPPHMFARMFFWLAITFASVSSVLFPPLTMLVSCTSRAALVLNLPGSSAPIGINGLVFQKVVMARVPSSACAREQSLSRKYLKRPVVERGLVELK
ncbi:hypothetical protein PBCV1_a514L [Paramecium bursaria Chlorella virus 1]|uniref:Uncharacterized protein n=1 Tax=Paramecium bursaria Chlorella virus 1 TaxID=10506 RepID=Q98564_PBCV1|nr:hypothetical protein PBCV1_a514L [Paramecium bursaria Chlorella virus 1]AAC96881.1 hypothetical protein [Paramecium bursaria Chlorella virus 1]